MKRAVIVAIVVFLAFALPAFAVESNEPPKGPAPTFEQKKAQLLKSLDERITKLQQEKTCVQAAKKDEDLQACMRKYSPFSPGGPGGMGHPGFPGGPPPKVSPPE